MKTREESVILDTYSKKSSDFFEGEEIEILLKLINSASFSGVENAKKITRIADKLNYLEDAQKKFPSEDMPVM